MATKFAAGKTESKGGYLLDDYPIEVKVETFTNRYNVEEQLTNLDNSEYEII